MEAARERLELPVEKMSKTVHKYGNTSAASIPISLVEELEAGKIKDGDVVVMVGFGGGLTWGARLPQRLLRLQTERLYCGLPSR